MRQVIPEAMQLGFECLAKNSPLEGAELIIEKVPIAGYCQNCGKKFRLNDWSQKCPQCSCERMEIISGKELEIVEFEGS